jgi:hypothetical protein
MISVHSTVRPKYWLGKLKSRPPKFSSVLQLSFSQKVTIYTSSYLYVAENMVYTVCIADQCYFFIMHISVSFTFNLSFLKNLSTYYLAVLFESSLSLENRIDRKSVITCDTAATHILHCTVPLYVHSSRKHGCTIAQLLLGYQ